MESFIAWVGFGGAWLLFAGPIYQATLELREEELDRDKFESARDNFRDSPRPSKWWWLLPPVAYIKGRQDSRSKRDQFFGSLEPKELETFVRFNDRANGWFMVAGGAVLLATKETYELVEHYEWPTWLFWIAIFIGVVISVAYTIMRTKRSVGVLGLKSPKAN